VTRLSALTLALALALAAAEAAGRGAGADETAAAADVRVNSVGMRMVRVPAGCFVMGSPSGAPGRQPEETQRRVTLTRPFRISATEVTQRQWMALMPRNPSPAPGDDLPVTSVSWRDAREFCTRLTEAEGATYRLPTEAEWEYACRAGETDPVADLAAVAWSRGSGDDGPRPVAGKQANAWRLHDMLGNVAEWTADVYAPYPDAPEDVDPTGPATGTTRVVRGGAFRSFPPALRCAARTSAPESYQLPHVGFRVVEELDPAATATSR
jgi:formylglycine-generating enzyme required for sulfatase activity